MTPAVAGIVFVPAAAASLAASALLVTRLERLAAALALPEAMLGLVVALAADAPEITSAVAAISSHRHDVGAGVVLGSNAFNIAALLGLAAIISRRVSLHRRVVIFEGTTALALALVALALVAGVLPEGAALALAAIILVPYVLVSAVHPAERHRLPLPRAWREWLAGAIDEEELELSAGLRTPPGGLADAALAAVALAVVLVASVTMERSAVAIGTRLGLAGVITGALVLAAVTSLPNAVSAVYLARRGRASATLSTALNSNALNVVGGLLLPEALIGVTALTTGTVLAGAWYAGLTLAVLALAYRGRGLTRRSGSLVVTLYLLLIPALLIAG